MATFFPGESHTFSEYLLVPGYSSSQCIPNNVSLKTPLTRFKRGEKPAITLNIPMVSAIMQSVSGVDMGVALATEGGLSFIYGSQSAESEAAMVKAVKDHKAGFVQSDSTLTPDMTMEQVIELKEKTGHSTMPVTDDGTPKGKLLGIVTSRDYRPSRDDHQTKVSEFMTPREQLIVGDKNISLKVANDVIWDNKLNALPIVDDNDHLMGIVFRKDYDSHKTNPNELLDNDKRYMVGAGINTRDYAERVPLLIEAGADVEKLNERLFESRSHARVIAERMALESLEFYYDDRCALICLTWDQIQAAGVAGAELEDLTSLPRSIEGVEVGLTLRQQKDGSFKISVRTGHDTNACNIARRLGGGGHPRAAGCEISGNPDNAKHAILEEVKKELDRADAEKAQ